MKKSLLALLLITTIAMGQGLRVFTGLSIPLGDFGDVYKSTMQYGGSYTMKMPGIEPPPGAELITEYLIGYAKYQGDTDSFITMREYTMIPLIANGILDMNPSAKDFGGLAPNLLLGIGYYLGTNSWTMESDYLALTYNDSEAYVGINIGGGADYYFNKHALLTATAKYHYMMSMSEYDTGSMSLFDIRLGAGFSF